MSLHQALRVYREDSGIVARYVGEEKPVISPGEVLIRTAFSSINFKDALGVTGKGQIFKKFPIVGGIDVAGIVCESKVSSLKEGDEVLVTGCGLGETLDGGYQELVAVPGEWVIPLPSGLSLRESMILGTAGFTAALCLHRLEENNLRPEKGPVLVTGASGGVGSLAISMLSSLGYTVQACSSRKEHHVFLEKLGATAFFQPDDLVQKKKPLEAGTWAGAIDNAGGEVLAGILASVQLWGNVASVGLVMNHRLNTTVMPFILRGVSLLGISSANCPRDIRLRLWERLSQELKPRHLELILQKEVPFPELREAFEPFMQRGVFGRQIVIMS